MYIVDLVSLSNPLASVRQQAYQSIINKLNSKLISKYHLQLVLEINWLIRLFPDVCNQNPASKRFPPETITQMACVSFRKIRFASLSQAF